MPIKSYLPKNLQKCLFGDRERWGLVPITTDPCWLEWEKTMNSIYENSQQQGIGKIVNNSGYKILNTLNLDNKTVLEIGPGNLPHIDFWNGRPKMYWLIDRREEFLSQAKSKLDAKKIAANTALLDTEWEILPVEAGSIDIVVSFYTLEHLYPLQTYLENITNVLKPGGLLVGAIPTEGGLAWGLGRYLTTRRWFLKHTKIDPDKIICWEHPNMANDIIQTLRDMMHEKKISFWPLKIPMIDFNLTIKFIYQKK